MDHKGILSSAFNMSLGFIPVIISILLCELITQDTAIYIGTGIGIIGIYLSYRRKGLLIPNFILYIATGVLALLSVAALIPGDYNKMQYSENQGNAGRYNGCLCSLRI